ncbi:polysaccharide deacetylase family protein [Sphingomonas nostoxanthinifaciens]|uniref:polysaccharide deacetylase family protein n=1 Tax=Sphingomonas nostoxanthinifaciens TaxID=2872652 RepID=UPI001CC1F569|nr:polysaccharide deacetylase family protein [Sphingomonas nostoxanthinifaciens]UAK22859.1 polysaccharide deacetylase family protein [Sphingomonas nostoxanthinifaciens]
MSHRRIARQTIARFLAVFGGIGLAFSPAAAGTVAITFDDLPIFGLHATATEAGAITTGLLDGFRSHHWQVTGFVNEIQLAGPDREQRIGLLRRWLDAGMDLGNHSYSHLSLTKTPLDAYIADVARGEAVTRVLDREHGKQERWFRHPYLETGPTLAIRHGFEAWLKDHGYRVAPVSMENSDWEFAEPYDAAIARHDEAQAAAIRAAYLDYTAAALPWYRKAAVTLLGREPAFVLLLHASRLNAASIDALAAILDANGLRSVTLDRAMRDPAYRIADDYVGPDGDEWLTRWSLTLHRDLPYASLPKVPAWIADLDQKIETAAPDAQAPPVK